MELVIGTNEFYPEFCNVLSNFLSPLSDLAGCNYLPVPQQEGSHGLTTLDVQDGKALLRLPGDINVAGSAELKQLLVQAFSTGKEVQLDLSTAATLDIAAIQLFWAAARHAEKTGTAFTVAGVVPEAILNGVREAGFEHFPVAIETEVVAQQTHDTDTITDRVE
jgi:anti-anti-sigma regulatory factor